VKRERESRSTRSLDYYTGTETLTLRDSRWWTFKSDDLSQVATVTHQQEWPSGHTMTRTRLVLIVPLCMSWYDADAHPCGNAWPHPKNSRGGTLVYEALTKTLRTTKDASLYQLDWLEIHPCWLKNNYNRANTVNGKVHLVTSSARSSCVVAT